MSGFYPRVAIDCGFVAHPERVRAQMEGGAVMALGNAPVGQVTFAQGRAQQSNFHDYQVLRLTAAPRETHVHILPNQMKSPAEPLLSGSPLRANHESLC